jgi:hypothetical protein
VHRAAWRHLGTRLLIALHASLHETRQTAPSYQPKHPNSAPGRAVGSILQVYARGWFCRRMRCRSSGTGIGLRALTFAPPVFPSGTQILENNAAATILAD